MPTKRKRNIPGKANAAGGLRGAGARRPSSRKPGNQAFSSSSRSTGPSMGVGKSRVGRSSNTTYAGGRSVGGGRKATGYNAPRNNAAGFGPSVQGGGPKKGFSPEVVLTRRNLLIGAGVVGGVAVLGGGATFAMDALEGNKSTTVEHISVPTDAVTELSSLSEANSADHIAVVGRFKLPYGTLVWADNDTVAACLTPTSSSSPLNTVNLLYLSSGNNVQVLSAAQGAAEGYEIFDVRCSEEGLIWVEANVYEGAWRVYTAALSSGEATSIFQVDQGDSAWLTPSIAAVGSSAFWQVMPNSTGSCAKEASVLRAARFGNQAVEVAYSSKRPFATRLVPCNEGVVITPRVESTSIYYQLTLISAEDHQTKDAMVLPSSMTPDQVGYGRSGFSFAFSNIYNYGDGIANLGTYTPTSAANPNNYNGLKWFHFGRTPTASPCWSGEWFFVKSTRAIAGVHFASNSYFMIDFTENTDSYGEYLVSTGTSENVVGLSQITSETEGEEDYALVRVYSPIAGSIGSLFG